MGSWALFILYEYALIFCISLLPFTLMECRQFPIQNRDKASICWEILGVPRTGVHVWHILSSLVEGKTFLVILCHSVSHGGDYLQREGEAGGKSVNSL